MKKGKRAPTKKFFKKMKKISSLLLVSISLLWNINCGEEGDGTDPIPPNPVTLNVVNYKPHEGATGVTLDKIIQVTFNKLLDKIQHEDAITVKDSSGEDANGRIMTDRHSLRFLPARFKQEETYTVTVSPEVCSGLTTLGKPYSFTFSTGLVDTNGDFLPSHVNMNPLGGLGRAKESEIASHPEVMLYLDNSTDKHILIRDDSFDSSFRAFREIETNKLNTNKLAVAGQFDNDGWDEVAFLTRPAGEGQRLAMFIMDTVDTNKFEEIPVNITLPVVDFFDAAAADFDGDGRDELALLTGRKGGSGFDICIIKWVPDADIGSDTGTYSVAKAMLDENARNTYPLGTGILEYGKIAAGDIDGDGLAEAVIVYHNSVKNRDSAGVLYNCHSTPYYHIYDDLTEGLELLRSSTLGYMPWEGIFLFHGILRDQHHYYYNELGKSWQDSYIDVELGDIDGDGVQEILFGLTEPYFEGTGKVFSAHHGNQYVSYSVKERLIWVDYRCSNGGRSGSGGGYNFDLYDDEALQSARYSFSGYEVILPFADDLSNWGRPISMLLTGDIDGDDQDEVILHNRIFKFEQAEEGGRGRCPALIYNYPVQIPEEFIDLLSDNNDVFARSSDYTKYFSPNDLAAGRGRAKAVGIADMDYDLKDEIVLFTGAGFQYYDIELIDQEDDILVKCGRHILSNTPLDFLTLFLRPGQPRLVFPNVDDDSMIVKLVDHDTYLGDNIVVAVVAAPPCSEDLGQNVDECMTTVDIAHYEQVEDAEYFGVHAGVLFGFEADVSIFDIDIFSFEADVTVGAGYNEKNSKGTMITDGNGWDWTENNSVIFEFYMYDRYKYKVLSHPEDPRQEGEFIYVNIPRGRHIQQVDLEYYNANNGTQRDIDRTIIKDLPVPGDLNTYPNKQMVENDIFAGRPDYHILGISDTPQGFPKNQRGSIRPNLTSNKYESVEWQVEGTIDAVLKSCVGAGVKACSGVSASGEIGYAYNRTWGKETTISGTIQGMSPEASQKWGFLAGGIYAYREIIESEEENQKILVVNYYVNRR